MAPHAEDQDMPDAAPPAETPAAQSEFEAEDFEDALDRIKMLPGGSDTAASFEFKEEDHTLGNALRHIIMKNPQVEFCGYSIPHPAEKKMNLRIQTYDGVNVQTVLEKGLDDLMDLCDVVIDKFQEATTKSKAAGR